MRFYNREEELSKLKKIDLLSQKTAQMTVITGRRRVGKTELIRKFLEDSGGGFYFFVARKRSAALLEEYTELLAEKFPTLVTPFRDFSEFFKFIFEISKKEKIIVVFDEFQNFKFIDRSVFSILQNYWDAEKSKVRLNLILVGSLITLMEKIFAGSSEPLFGRATQKIYLDPFSPDTVRDILGDYNLKGFNALLNFYTIFGGIPKYYANLEMEQPLKGKAFFEIIYDLFLAKDALLQNEGLDLLIEEFGKNYQTYFSLLQVIASGSTKMSEISSKVGIPVTALSRILENLIKVFRLLERRQPIFTKSSRSGRYYLNDNFLTFWFRYIFRFRSLLEIGREKKVLDFIRKDVKTLQGLVFERMVQQELLEREKRGEFIFEIDEIGRFWDRIGHEVDLVAYNKKVKKIFFGECKLSPASVNFQTLTNLKAMAAYLPWLKGERKEYYGIMTVGKIRPELKRKFIKENVLVWEL